MNHSQERVMRSDHANKVEMSIRHRNNAGNNTFENTQTFLEADIRARDIAKGIPNRPGSRAGTVGEKRSGSQLDMAKPMPL